MCEYREARREGGKTLLVHTYTIVKFDVVIIIGVSVVVACHSLPPPIRNVAEAMVSKGYATVIRYRQDDDQRASCYDDLLSAEAKASKSSKGLHNKKETPIHRVADLSSVSGCDLLCSSALMPLLLM